MEITVRREDLSRELQLIQGIVDRRGAIAILSNTLIETGKDEIHLSATDLDVSIRTACPVRVQKKGAVTVGARKLNDIVRALPTGSDLHLSHIEGKGERDAEGFLGIESERTSYKVATLSKEDFPTLPVGEGKQEIAIDAKTLISLIDRTAFAITVEDARYYLGGALLLIEPTSLAMVTTDGHRLCFAREAQTSGATGSERILIPRKAIQQLKLVCEGEEKVMFSRTENHLTFRSARRTLSSKVVEGQFPAHEKVIATKGNKVARAQRVALLDALRRVSLLSTERSKAIRFTLRAGEIEVVASSPEQGEARESIAAEFSGDTVEIGFNAQYLIDFLSVVTDAEITVELKDSDAQGIFYPTSKKGGGSEHRYVVMPMRL
jgi:DNA polymerase-3 subunit beta